jgi:RNA polymerase sigma-70 factor (ECF subfamily)
LVEEFALIADLQNAAKKEQAFKKLVTNYKERLYWHIRKIVISHEDADDVLQNTFIKIFRNIDNFKQESQLFSWMYRIATNESITFINKRAREKKVPISEYQEHLGSNLTNDSLFSGDDIQILLQQAIKTLPTKQQLVFNMKYFDNLKYKQISSILETSEGALKASYFHAVKKIVEFVKKRSI